MTLLGGRSVLIPNSWVFGRNNQPFSMLLNDFESRPIQNYQYWHVIVKYASDVHAGECVIKLYVFQVHGLHIEIIAILRIKSMTLDVINFVSTKRDSCVNLTTLLLLIFLHRCNLSQICFAGYIFYRIKIELWRFLSFFKLLNSFPDIDISNYCGNWDRNKRRINKKMLCLLNVKRNIIIEINTI